MIIDCHNHIGYDTYYGINREPEELLKEMNVNGIDKCVIFPFTNNPDVIIQNKYVLKNVEKYPDRFIGFFNMNPKIENMTKLMLEYYKKGFKGVVTDPRFGISHANKLFHELVECATILGIPIWLHSDDKQVDSFNISDLSSLINKYPGAFFILTSMYKESVYISHKHKNVFLDTAVFELSQDLVRLIKPLGTLRILMGSNSPRNSLKHEKHKINISNELSEFQKELIMGKNLIRLVNL